jgi:hypothetical protein
MGSLELSAQLVASPSCGSGSFPSGVTNIPFGLNPPCNGKGYSVTTGVQVANVASPSAYASLGGIGSGGPVTHCTTLYLRVVTAVSVQLTFANSTTIILPGVFGLLLLESAAGDEITGVAVEGTATVEYAAFGMT